MTPAQVLKELKGLGDEKRRAFNSKNGVGDDQFGVPMGDIRAVAKKLKSDHALGLQLWKNGNFEARLVATLIMKPKSLSASEVDAMVRVADTMQLAEWLGSSIVKEHPEKETLRERWMTEKHPCAARFGWSLTAERVNKAPEGLDLPGLLDRIEAEMPAAHPHTQWTMNATLAAIGIHHPKLRKRAVAIGEKLGIYRDYPCSKGCTSPFAPIWIAEMVRRNA